MAGRRSRDPGNEFNARLRQLIRDSGFVSYRDLEAATADLPDQLFRSTVSDRLLKPSPPDGDFVRSVLAACARRAGERGVRVDTSWDTWRVRLAAAQAEFEGERERARREAAAAAELARLRAPRQLPLARWPFAGRAGELATMTRLLDEVVGAEGATLLLAVGGPAGVGKTTLALQWAHAVAGRFPDGQLHASLLGHDPRGGPLPPGEAIRGFLLALGVPAAEIPGRPEERVALYRTAVAGKRLLVVLDDAAGEEQVRPLLPGTPGCAVVVTSRRRLEGLVAIEGAVPLRLGLFDPGEARELLARRLRDGRVQAEPAAADDLVELAAGLPLAMAIVAARAARQPGEPLAAVAGALRAGRDRLDALSTSDHTADVRAVLSWSYRQLDAGTGRVFRLLGLHPGPHASAAAVASLAGVPPAEADVALAELTAAQLLDRDGDRYAAHELLRAYATELASTTDGDGDRRAAVRRVLDHYLRSAHAAALLWDPHRDPIPLTGAAEGVRPQELSGPEDALAWLTREAPVLLRAVRLAADTGLDEHAWQLAWCLADFLNRQGYWQELFAAQEVALAAATRLGDRAAQARTHRALGRAHLILGRPGQSAEHLERALALMTELGDAAGRGHTLIDLSVMHDRQGAYAEALRRAEEAGGAYAAAGDVTGQANALNGVGWYRAQLGDVEGGLAPCREALALLRGAGDQAGTAATLDSLGFIHDRLGRHAEAAASFAEAAGLFEAVGDPLMEAETSVRLGDTQAAAGDRDAARAAWRRAEALYERLGEEARTEEVRGRLAAPDDA